MSGAEVLGLSHLLMGVTGKYIFKNPDYSGNLEIITVAGAGHIFRSW